MPADTSPPSRKAQSGKPAGRAQPSDRQARQAAALKANLQRRKQQARARRSSADTEATADADADGAEEAGPQAEDTPSGR
ncbi:hypothetical protein [Pyruvatibacter mobilis]|uniref:hypothetical protein n=1 Tax=Pyruvatibacter mobilis TaxID=1712261 RepID=UPI003C7BB660